MSSETGIAHYRITARIGEGGMGVVYRATDSKLHREVALKVVAQQYSRDPQWRSRFQREAQVLAALNHPNIAAIYGLEESGEVYAIAMELVEGVSLAERIAKRPVPVADALDIARQIAGALEYAHDEGIVHRDLKPANVKLRPDGVVKVLDFGLAKTVDSGAGPLETATRTGLVMGTPAYMSPEQASGKRVDKRADIWAFGVVLYEMVTGCRPFPGDSVSDVLAAVLTKEPDWTLVPPRTADLLRRCLEKDPKQRLRDIGDARFLLEEPQPSAPAPRPVRYWKTVGAVAASIALTAVVCFKLLPRPTPGGVLRFSVDLGEDAALQPYRSETMALSPDGARLVYTTDRQVFNSKLALRRLDLPKSTLLAGTNGAEAPFFSPDGRYVAFFADGVLKKVDIGSGTVSTICDAPTQRGGSWGDDDNIVFARTRDGGLWRVPAAGGAPEEITRVDPQRKEDSHRYPQVLPGAHAVVFMNSPKSNGESPIEVQPLPKGNRRILVPMGAFARYLPSGHLVYIHNRILYAAPMDVSNLRLTGPPVQVLEDVNFRDSTSAAAFAFSQSGMFVYVSAKPDDRIRPVGVLDEKGNVDWLPIARGRYSHPRVSWDAKRLALNFEGPQVLNIWTYDWSSHRFASFVSPPGSRNAIWTHDGKYLAYFNGLDNPGPGIYILRSDGVGDAVRLVAGKGLVPQCFTANGSRMLYEADLVGPEQGLWLLPVDWMANGPKPGVAARIPNATDGPANFSPDGRWLAFIGGTAGMPDVQLRPYPGPGGPWQVSTGGNNPFWSRTSHQLFYRGLPDSQVMAAEYSVSGNSLSPAAPRVWSEMRVDSFDLMPDGKHIVMIPAAEQKDVTHATFVLNFMDDLRRRVNPKGKNE